LETQKQQNMHGVQELATISFDDGKLEELAAELEVTVDYYLAEFFIPCDSCGTVH
jgi:hypothetical protein